MQNTFKTTFSVLTIKKSYNLFLWWQKIFVLAATTPVFYADWIGIAITKIYVLLK